MIESIEKELKYLVERKDFYNLKNYLENSCYTSNIVVQNNYYFDTKDYALKNQGITMRLREINHQVYFFTIKVKNAEISNNLHIKKEYNMQID